jgi:four helix bundle protein
MNERPHKKLEGWRKAMDLVVEVYKATATFPAEERFGLSAQMRRAAVSVPSNIAEGAARGSNRFFVSSLQIARASLSELDTQIAVALRLGYIKQTVADHLDEAADEIERILNGLIASTRRKVAAATAALASTVVLLVFLAV